MQYQLDDDLKTMIWSPFLCPKSIGDPEGCEVDDFMHDQALVSMIQGWCIAGRLSDKGFQVCALATGVVLTSGTHNLNGFSLGGAFFKVFKASSSCCNVVQRKTIHSNLRRQGIFFAPTRFVNPLATLASWRKISMMPHDDNPPQPLVFCFSLQVPFHPSIQVEVHQNWKIKLFFDLDFWLDNKFFDLENKLF